ncbi:hypothetical protein ACKKBF_B19865 [Auxenochlorella protothecoides x Auxenochlorella symbiontica]
MPEDHAVRVRAGLTTCAPRRLSLAMGQRVHLNVTSGPPQSFRMLDGTGALTARTPMLGIGQNHVWQPVHPGRYKLQSDVFPKHCIRGAQAPVKSSFDRVVSGGRPASSHSGLD